MAAFSSKLKEKARSAPHRSGVYSFYDRFGNLLYVGKAKDLKKRLSYYARASQASQKNDLKIAVMVKQICDIDWTLTGNEQEALLLESRLIQARGPKYNTQLQDNKQFLLVKLDRSAALPLFSLTRNVIGDQARYFGPFPKSKELRYSFQQLRRLFGVLLKGDCPRQLPCGRWQLHRGAAAEVYRSEKPIEARDYHRQVEAACAFLEGKLQDQMQQLEQKMQQASRAQRYEQATYYRDTLQALRASLKPKRHRPLPETTDGHAASQHLAEILHIKQATILEAFDIAHISGHFVVGAAVRFVHGKSDRRFHRLYHIRDCIGNNDYQAMRQLISRHFLRLHHAARGFPHLVLLDGGVTQLQAATRAFQHPLLVAYLPQVRLLALSKREEHIHLPQEKPLLLPRHHATVKLLQRARNEAHRVANAFHDRTRRSKIKESILDQLSGLGQQRKQALLKHFGSLESLKKAKEEALRHVPGIGPVLANKLINLLHKQGEGQGHK